MTDPTYTFNMSFGYNRASTLPRRTFVVNVEATYVGTTDPAYLTFNVTAPDGLAAEGIVRRSLWSNHDLISDWRMTMVREVVTPRWSDDLLVVRIPEGFCWDRTTTTV